MRRFFSPPDAIVVEGILGDGRIILVLVLSFGAGCTTLTHRPDSSPVYAGINPPRLVKYRIHSNDPRVVQLFDLALGHWNKAVGYQALIRTDRRSDVEVVLRQSATVAVHPARTRLLGCLDAFKGLAVCEVDLQIPTTISTQEHVARLSHLFVQGPIDAQLYDGRDYGDDMGAYLRDKVTLLSFVHEIGHTLGLAHADSHGDCVMASVPSGRLAFCDAELKAVRAQLGGLPVMARR